MIGLVVIMFSVGIYLTITDREDSDGSSDFWIGFHWFMNLLFDFIKYLIKFWTIRLFIVLVIVIGTLVLLNHFFDLQLLFLIAYVIYAFVTGKTLWGYFLDFLNYEKISIHLISFKNFNTNCCAAFSKARDLSISVLFDTLPSWNKPAMVEISCL